MGTRIPATCGCCGKEYSADKAELKRPRKNGHFCSLSCASQMRWKLKGIQGTHNNPCAECGEMFYRPPKHVSRVKRAFCSRACRDRAKRGANNPMFSGGSVELACAHCATAFFVIPSRATKTRFCSVKCRALAFAIARRKVIACSHCRAEFVAKSFHRSKQCKARTFCSRECASLAHRQHIAGPNNPRYVHGNGEEDYPAEFRKASIAVRERDRYRCQLCWKTEKANGAAMDVHHIDYDKENSDISNLISLCRVCHGSMHGLPKRRKQMTRYWRKFLDQPQMRLAVSA